MHIVFTKQDTMGEIDIEVFGTETVQDMRQELEREYGKPVNIAEWFMSDDYGNEWTRDSIEPAIDTLIKIAKHDYLAIEGALSLWRCEEALRYLENGYCIYKDEADFGLQMAQELFGLDNSLLRWFDADGYGYALLADYLHWQARRGSKVVVFSHL